MKVTPELYSVKIENTTWLSSDNKPEAFMKERAKFEDISFMEVQDFDESQQYSQVLATPEKAVLSKDQMVELLVAGIKFEVEQKVSVEVDITQQLIDIAEKPVSIAMESSKGNTYNNKCEVHMPGNMMAMYNRMMLLEDACTDALQCALNAGWRIVAACPQPDQRRPDYVLGRFDPNYDGGETSADRG